MFSGSGAEPGDVTRTLVRDLVLGAAWRSERTLALARMVFAGAVLVRSLLVTTPALARTGLGVPPMLAALGFSAYVLLRPARGSASERFLLLSVSVDAVAGFLALLPMALWPELPLPLLNKLDISVLLLVVVASAFRLSVKASLLSCALNTASFLTLMHYDRAAPWTHVEREVAVLYLMFMVGCGTMAALIAQRTRTLVASSARASLDADHAQRNLALVLREHHDLRSQLAAATMNVELAGRELAAEPAARGHARAANVCVERARHSLRQINDSVGQIKERSYQALARIEEARPADLCAALADVQEEVERRFPIARLEVRSPERWPSFRVVGGTDGLRRMLLNLIVNSYEGSGSGAASEVVVEVGREQGPNGSIVVRDNGPGFAAQVFARQRSSRRSSKPEGSGLGLSFVEQLAAQSSGRVELRNHPAGAEVRVTLPVDSRRS